jgi:hypothetical protein
MKSFQVQFILILISLFNCQGLLAKALAGNIPFILLEGQKLILLREQGKPSKRHRLNINARRISFEAKDISQATITLEFENLDSIEMIPEVKNSNFFYQIPQVDKDILAELIINQQRVPVIIKNDPELDNNTAEVFRASYDRYSSLGNELLDSIDDLAVNLADYQADLSTYEVIVKKYNQTISLIDSAESNVSNVIPSINSTLDLLKQDLLIKKEVFNKVKQDLEAYEQKFVDKLKCTSKQSTCEPLSVKELENALVSAQTLNAQLENFNTDPTSKKLLKSLNTLNNFSYEDVYELRSIVEDIKSMLLKQSTFNTEYSKKINQMMTFENGFISASIVSAQTEYFYPYPEFWRTQRIYAPGLYSFPAKGEFRFPDRLEFIVGTGSHAQLILDGKYLACYKKNSSRTLGYVGTYFINSLPPNKIICNDIKKHNVTNLARPANKIYTVYRNNVLRLNAASNNNADKFMIRADITFNPEDL